MSLGKQIKRYREKLNLTLEQLEERSGVSFGTISALEVRESRMSKYAGDIARGLGLTLDQLMDESKDWIEDSISSESLENAKNKDEEIKFLPRVSRPRFNKLSATQKAGIEEWIIKQMDAYLGMEDHKSDNLKRG